MVDTQPRTFLIVADASPEMPVALRYAAWRAHHIDARIALLHVIEPHEIQQWRAVEKVLAADAIAAGKAALRQHEEFVERLTSHKPALYIRRGDMRTELLRLLDEQPDISALVLAAHTGPKGPGPLVSYLTSAKGIGKLHIPLVIVPETYKMQKDDLLV